MSGTGGSGRLNSDPILKKIKQKQKTLCYLPVCE